MIVSVVYRLQSFMNGCTPTLYCLGGSWGGGGFETIKTKNPIAKFTATFDLKLHGKHQTEDNLVA